MNSSERSHKTSQRQILKSTGIVGVSQVITIVLQIVRTKIIAIFLGPQGIGLLGIYNSIVDLSRNATGLGINFSGVREIAQAKSLNNPNALGSSVLVLKRWSIITGLFGALLLIIFCVPICRFSFKDTSYALSVVFLAIAVFFSSLSQAQIALLQGMRELTRMAKASVFGVLASILIITPIYYFFGARGMIPAIILMSFSAFLLSAYYSSKTTYEKVNMSWVTTVKKGGEMVKIGFSTAISGIVSTLSLYFVRSFISSHGSIADVGYFQAGWTISNVYILSVLNSMAADFFPRLSAINKDNNKVNSLVNDQTEIALIIGSPLVVLMLSFSSVIISVLYSSSFASSTSLLRFFVLGSLLKILSWPICFISAAKGAIKQIVISELSWNILFVFLTIISWNKLGLFGVGIAYVLSYFLYLIIVFILVNPLSHFRWSSSNVFLIIFYSFWIIVAFLITILLPQLWYISIGCVVIVSAYSYTRLRNIINLNELLSRLRRQKQ